MIPVNHARHAIETEAVEMIFLHPELAVAQEKTHDLILSVVEATGTPCRMMALRAFVKIEVITAIKQAKALILIAATMRMYYIHHDSDSHSVCGVHQFLELLRRAETRAQREEVRHLIAE